MFPIVADPFFLEKIFVTMVMSFECAPDVMSLYTAITGTSMRHVSMLRLDLF